MTARAAVAPSAPADERLIAGRNPLTGATIANLSPAEADAHGIDPFLSGVYITRLDPRSIAAGMSQLQAGDMILAVNGQQVKTTREVEGLMAGAAQPRRWRITVQRGGQVAELALNI